MTLEEAEKKFGISHNILEQYVCSGLIRKADSLSEENFCDEDFESLRMIDTLLNAGFTTKEAKEYLLHSGKPKTEQQQITMLTNKRRIILDEIHQKQKLLDCLDYMLWEKRKEMEESVMFNESFVLANGVKIPKLGLGTWFIEDSRAEVAICHAVSIGYRHIDTAQAYGNESGIGNGIRKCGIPQEELFITSKVAAEHTVAAAREIQKQTGGELFAISTEKKYPVSHSKCSEVAKKEFDSGTCPKLTSHVKNINQYDIVFIGYPIWWYREPMAIHSFLAEYDLSGKTMVPFCTSLGAGIGKSEKNIAKLCPKSKVLKGLSLETERKERNGE